MGEGLRQQAAKTMEKRRSPVSHLLVEEEAKKG